MIKVVLQFASPPPKRGKARAAGKTMTIYSSTVSGARSDIAARSIQAELTGQTIVEATLYNDEDYEADVAAGHKPMPAKVFNTEEIANLRVESVL